MNKNRQLKTKEVIKMPATVKIKPIKAITVISEEKYINEVKDSLSKTPTASACAKNIYSLNLLKKARRG